ncbi:archaetidylserine decarboxylase [Aneurinibacillus sp. Ricciae_BoGa-3]|uniref:archaetidylserine decarboxylase n=1 Tax=Aneurinibacillus sp. Ricciae_BoGa-3 TaxID=3022697 RepID=UPI00234189BB|nr:archaetidylserine decarboxylase [Aneurinibacillus sp. Ricciae_BoGa-3]WCK56399.1 archaetidylserine decarboxylase [Aneurinibacillus sp. Ricciae_BoGa-3]
MKRLAKTVISLLPQNQISALAGRITRSPFSKRFIRLYVQKYGIDTSDIEKPVELYKNLNEFFTRKLVRDARPVDLDPNSIVSPVDGTVSQLGKVKDGSIIQAKGVYYTVEQLLGKEKAHCFQNGTFITIYLSPRDYHRIHMPVSGKITSYHYIPGRLYPVNEIGVHHVPGLFTKNERLTSYITTDFGQVALVKVGAFIVGSVQLSYEHSVHHQHRGNELIRSLDKHLEYKKGEEIGFFEFGSTVILLFEESIATIRQGLVEGSTIKMGEKIGEFLV